MSRIYYRSAKAAIICYGTSSNQRIPDMIQISPTKRVSKKFSFGLTNSHQTKKVVRFSLWAQNVISNQILILIFLVDMVEEGTPRGVTNEEARKFAQQHNARSYETSSKSGVGIEELFDDIGATYLSKDSMPPPSHTIKPSNNTNNDEKKKGGCC
jgi:hypothetical protein